MRAEGRAALESKSGLWLGGVWASLPFASRWLEREGMLDRITLLRMAAVLASLFWAGDRLVAQASTGTPSTATAHASSTAKKKPVAKTPTKPAASRTTTAGAKKKATVATQGTSHAIARTSATGKHTAYKPPTASSIKLTSAFHASEELRPMAQQLASTRSAAAYAGVLSYAHGHPGEGAAAAYLALGHAYALDHRYADAVADLGQAKRAGNALDDYADYLGAQAAVQAGRAGDAYTLLDHFAERYPDSIFVPTAPVLLANMHLQQGDAQGALRVLQPLASTPEAEQADFRYALGRAYQLAGDTGHAAPLFRAIYAMQPLTSEAAPAAAQLQAMGTPLSAGERKTHADVLFNAKRYSEASAEYSAIGKNNPQLSLADRDGLTIYAAVCDFKLKHLGRRDIEKLPDTSDDTAALKLYMLAELSRNEDDRPGHDALITQMIQRFPTSRWLEEALYSGGNMYLLKHDAAQAIFPRVARLDAGLAHVRGKLRPAPVLLDHISAGGTGLEIAFHPGVLIEADGARVAADDSLAQNPAGKGAKPLLLQRLKVLAVDFGYRRDVFERDAAVQPLHAQVFSKTAHRQPENGSSAPKGISTRNRGDFHNHNKPGFEL